MSVARIPEIGYPPEHIDDLKRITPIILESLERDCVSVEKGSVELGKLDRPLDIAYFYFIWISECNDVIGNLNLILDDLRALPQRALFLTGSPWSRYELLVRTFFHEFYRLREILNTVLASCTKRGFIEKDELRIAREAFHGAVEETIELRNCLVHGKMNWSGEGHLTLTMVSTALSRGMRLVHRETEEEQTVEAALKPVCERGVATLQSEGEKVSIIMTALVQDMVAITRNISQETPHN